MAISQVQSSANIAVTTGTQIAQATVSTKRSGYLHLVAVSAQGASTAVITVYDSQQTSGAPTGNVLATISVPTTWSDRIDFGGSLYFALGLYVVISGTGALGQVTFE